MTVYRATYHNFECVTMSPRAGMLAGTSSYSEEARVSPDGIGGGIEGGHGI